jgi:hypothetical protein
LKREHTNAAESIKREHITLSSLSVVFIVFHFLWCEGKVSCPVYTCTMYIVHVCTSIYTVYNMHFTLLFSEGNDERKEIFYRNILKILRLFTPPVCVPFFLAMWWKVRLTDFLS